jgi:hypothetical protein
MTPEEYERFKDAEKQHLRKLKELKKAVGKLEREKSIRTALENVSAGPADMLDRQKNLVDRLAMETAQHEARLEVALERSEEVAREAQAAGLEEELQRDRAQALVRQLKRELQEGDERDGVIDEKSQTESQNQGAGNETGGAATEEGGAATEEGGAATEEGGAATEEGGAATEEGGAAKERSGGENEKRRDRSKEHDRRGDGSGTAKVAANPTSSRGDRPEKTIGRM